VLVRDDGGAVHFEAQHFDVGARGVGAAASGEQHAVAGDLMLAGGVGIADAAGRNGLDLGVQAELHALFFVGLHEDVADLGVRGAGDLRHHLDDDDLDADGREIARHFEADDAAADADERLGQLAQIEDLAVRHDEARGQAFLEAGNGRHGRAGAGGEHEALAPDGLAGRVDFKAAGRFGEHLALALVDLDLVGLHRKADAGDQCLDDLVLAVNHGGVIIGHVFRVHAVALAVLRARILLGAVQKALGRDAALVQAGAAQRALFDERNLQSALRRAFRAQIAAGAAADNNDVILFHISSLLFLPKSDDSVLSVLL